jgi:hypothetical protein
VRGGELASEKVGGKLVENENERGRSQRMREIESEKVRGRDKEREKVRGREL